MVGVILLSRKCNINPDNVATPIAASLGDLTTLGLLAWIASVLYNAKGECQLVGFVFSGIDVLYFQPIGSVALKILL